MSKSAKSAVILFVLSILTICSCGGGDSKQVSEGLKIFFTYEQHVGNFADDPTLIGSNGIEKADDFCMESVMRPSAAQYKALLVDGVNRDAATLTDWVLKPNTIYYRWYDDIPIDVTTSESIFNVYFQNLLFSIESCDIWGQVCESSMLSSAWTGIGDTQDFSTGADTCGGWTTVEGSGITGSIRTTGTGAFSNSTRSCSTPIRLFCVEQPGS